jgi:hypothetical protein
MAAFFLPLVKDVCDTLNPVNIPSPVLISQQAVRRLPRLALIALAFIYVFAGFWGHDPWKRIDVASFGYMWSLATNQSSHFDLQIAGMQPEFKAYLPYWLGGWSIQWFQNWISPEIAARIPFSLLSLVSMVFIWSGIYYLARNPQAQPVAFAFGGEAEPKDYARSLADAGLLAYIACLGLALPSHETTPMAMQLYGAATMFAGATALPFFPKRAIAIWYLGLLLMLMSGAPSIAAILGLGSFFLWLKHPQAQKNQIMMMMLALVSLLVLTLQFDLWEWRILPISELAAHWREKGELLIWFLWPAWPLAIWTLWRWRGHWGSQVWSQHLILPSFIFTATLIASLLTSAPEKTLLLALPSIAALAAFAMPTLSRSMAALIDWFTLLFFTGGAVIIWGVWLSLQTGIPAQPALNVMKLVPGFVHSFNLIDCLIALTVTSIWVKLIHWRIGRHPSAIWKSLVLPASGAALCWVLLMTLWLPILDRALSYKPWAIHLVQIMKKPKCVFALDLERSQLAGLSFHGQFEFKQLQPKTDNNQCEWLVSRQDIQRIKSLENSQKDWVFKLKSKRPADRNEEVWLYQKRISRDE